MKNSSAPAKCPRRLPITVDAEVRGGEPCFTGTRVPVSSPFVSLDAFPAVKHGLILAVLESSTSDSKSSVLSSKP